MKFITIYVNLISPTGKPVKGQIIVKDNYAMSLFTDKTLAKKLYEADLAQGKDVAYNKIHNAYIQRFKGKKAGEIRDILIKEIKKIGGVKFRLEEK